MKKIRILLLIQTSIILITACTAKQLQPISTPELTENRVVPMTQNIETAYPNVSVNEPVSLNETWFETAYPSIENTSTPLPAGILPVAPQEAIEPEEGMASISGLLYSFAERQVLSGMEYFLLQSQAQSGSEKLPSIVSPDPTRGDIIGKSDNNGNINLNNIPPGKYYLVVWSPMNWSLAQVSEEDTTPLVLDLKDGSRIPLGIIYISLP
jgi:hypothetical protein